MKKVLSGLLVLLLCAGLLAGCSAPAAPAASASAAAPVSQAASVLEAAASQDAGTESSQGPSDVSQPASVPETASAPQSAASESASVGETASTSGGESASGYTIQRRSRDEEAPMGEAGSWTILMYVCGTDLERKWGMASFNIEQILEAIPGDDVNVVMQTGGAETWGNPAELVFELEGDFSTAVVDPTVLQRYELTDELTLVDEQPLASMGSQNTLYEFLSWGVENYPAERMGVILWDHGGGPLGGVCCDELFEMDRLYPFELSNAFDKVYDEMTDRFEFIGFDACLMASIEVANALAPHARYMYASQETEDGFGWYYESLIDELNRGEDVDGLELGAALCDSYFDFYRMLGSQSTATLSVVDLEKVDGVLYALDDLALELQQGLEDTAYLAEVSRAVARAESYRYDHLHDLADLADKLAHLAPDEAAALIEAVDAAVAYAVNGGGHAYSNGLSVYYPTGVSEKTVALYGLARPTPAYYAYIDALQSEMLKVALSGQTLVDITAPPALDGEGRYSMEIAPATLDYVRETGFALYLAPEGNESAYLLGYDNDVEIDFETGLVHDKFEAEWAHLDGEPLRVTLTDYTEEYSTYTAPIMLNGERTNLILQWVWDEDEEKGGYYEMVGTSNGTDPYTGMASRTARPLEAGDSVVPLYGVLPADAVTSEEYADPEEYLDENGQLVLTPGTTIRIREDSAVTKEALEAGRYLYQFGVFDIYGVEQTFAPIPFDVDEEGAVRHPALEEDALPPEDEDGATSGESDSSSDSSSSK